PDVGPVAPRTPVTLSDIANGATCVVDAEGLARNIAPAAEALARHLSARGVASGEFVGILLPRSVEAVTAVVAVARAGAPSCRSIRTSQRTASRQSSPTAARGS
ncbi:AMP-binding protein, partial [Rhodococcus hoagii]|nr:AMP-binding protein [Prescottella equi]